MTHRVDNEQVVALQARTRCPSALCRCHRQCPVALGSAGRSSAAWPLPRAILGFPQATQAAQMRCELASSWSYTTSTPSSAGSWSGGRLTCSSPSNIINRDKWPDSGGCEGSGSGRDVKTV